MQQRPRFVSRRGGREPGPSDVARQLAAEVNAAQDVVHVDADGLAKLRAVEAAARGDVVRRRLLASGLLTVARLLQRLSAAAYGRAGRDGHDPDDDEGQ
jgi:hypothetical protein